MKFFEKYYIEFTVFICGAMVMIYELVGSRITAPYLGTSTYVWTSLIGVILASLSLGYAYGGKMADKNPDKNVLSYIVLISSVAVFLTILLKDIILKIFSGLTPVIELNCILISVILFSPASFLLGVVSPYAVKLKNISFEKTGSAVGNLYALSTFGSIVGTFSAGFFLIPAIGTTKILFIIVILLALTAVVISKNFLKIKIILILLYISVFFYNNTINKDFSKIGFTEIDTLYNKIWIYKGVYGNKETINLATDPYGTQCSMFVDESDLVFEYTKYYRLISYFKPDLKKSLMIGGCNYSYPKDYLKMFTGATIDVAEIDPGMTETAKKYFNLQENPRMKIYHEDGRIFLNKSKEKYDTILIDAFNSFSSVPYHLTTIEAVRNIYNSLNNDGVVMMNIISSIEGEKGKFFRAEYETYKQIFPQVYVIPVDTSNGDISQNLIMIALKSNKEYNFNTENIEFKEYLQRLRKKEILNDTSVLTDEYAPVESYKYKSL